MKQELSADELYLQNQKLTQDITQLSKKLEKSDNYKTHFLSNMRNCIGNPFASIMGLAQHIIKVQKHDWKKVIRVSAMIHSEAFSLDFQLKNVFCAAEVEAGAKQPLPMEVRISEFLNNEINAHRFLFRKKNLAWKIQLNGEEENFCTDATFLSLIVSNLFHNAYKYSHNDGEIHISSTIKDGELVLIIKDHGVGIEKEMTGEVFDRFERIDEGINSIDSGQGLGLAIVKMLVELLNGSITIQSEIDEFTSLKIVIPEMEKAEALPTSMENDDFFIEEGTIF